MSGEAKRNLQSLILWIVLMASTYLIWGFESFGWLLGYGWTYLIISGIVILIFEKLNLINKIEPTVGNNALLVGLDAYQKGFEAYTSKNFSQALHYFNEAIENGYYKNVYGLRADCYHQSALFKEALKDFNDAISADPNDCNLYFQRSFTEQSLNNKDGAISDLKKAIQLSRIDNKTNMLYMDSAKEMGWAGGHTALYKSHLKMLELR